MKKWIQHIIQKRNPNFLFDPTITSSILAQFFVMQAWAMFRGLKLILKWKKPRGLLLGKNSKWIAPTRIRFGKFLKIGDHVTLSGLGTEGIVLGDNVGIGSFSQVIVSTSLNQIGKGIKIGNNVGIGEFAYLGGAGGLEIGDNCIIGQYLSCHPENHNYTSTDELIRLQGVNRKGISIGDNCWIGSKVTVLDGVHIGHGCIIAAGAVVTQSFASHSVLGGVPAKLIKSRM